MKYQYYFLIAIFIVQGNLYAIHPTVRNFNRKESNAGTQNWDIVQHKNDWMYFANNKGLLEYDGNRWTIYPIRNYTNVRSLCYDEQTDRIYAGAFNEFGYYTRNERGLFTYNSLIEKISPSERNFNEIWNIHKIDNSLYFQGDNEIFRYRNNRISRFSFRNKIDCSGVVHNSLFISSTMDGVSFLNGDMFMKIPDAEQLKNKRICAILPFENNKVLFVTDFHGLFLFDGEKIESYKTDIDDFMSDNQLFCATIKGSKLALGTVRNGLVVKDLKNNTNVFSNISSGLQNNTILSLSFDHQNNLWLGLDKGIDYVLINSPIYDLFGNSQIFGAGYSSLIRKNTLYLGTNQGLYTTPFPITNSPNPTEVSLLPRMQGQVWNLTLIDDNIFCGSDHGVFIVEGNTVKQIPGIPGTWNFRTLRGKPDCILGSSYQGFFIMKKINGKWQFSNFIKGFEDSGGMFEEDIEGYIWFSHWMKGISRLKLNENLDSIVSIEQFDASKGIASKNNNTLFFINDKIVFSTTNGFFFYNHKTKTIERHTELINIFGNPMQSTRLNKAPNGDIWSTSHKFIYAAFIQPNNTYKVDSLSFGSLKSKLISGFEHFNFVNETNIIVSTEDGFSWIDLSKARKVKSQFKVAIRNIYITNYGDSIVCGYQESQNSNKIPEYEFKNNSIRFEFVAPEFSSEGSVSYSYILENYDLNWSAYSLVNTKEYTKLKTGTYTFRVSAKSLLEETPVETSYTFTIMPPWYQSNIAYIVYFLVFIFLIFRLQKFIKYRSEKGAREMEIRKEIELKEQERKFEEDAIKKRKEIIELKNHRLQYELRHKSQDLASSTMNLIRKNEILLEINTRLAKISKEFEQKQETEYMQKQLGKMQQEIKRNIQHDNDWNKFHQNFDMVYENYLKRLGEEFPSLTVSDKKLCAYLKMDLSSKDIAPLLNMSYRSVEMSRYRLRKKLMLDRDVNLTDFLQNF